MTESCRLVTTEQYKEYQELKEQCDHWHKEAERISHEAIGSRLEEITLKKKLEIATKALEEYDNRLNWDIRGVSFMKYNKGFTIARKALKEMEGVK